MPCSAAVFPAAAGTGHSLEGDRVSLQHHRDSWRNCQPPTPALSSPTVVFVSVSQWTLLPRALLDDLLQNDSWALTTKKKRRNRRQEALWVQHSVWALFLYPVIFRTQRCTEHRPHRPCLEGHKIPVDKPSPDFAKDWNVWCRRIVHAFVSFWVLQEFCSLSKGRFELWHGRRWRIFQTYRAQIKWFSLKYMLCSFSNWLSSSLICVL